MAVKKKAVAKTSKKEIEYVNIRKIDNGFVATASVGGEFYGANAKEVFCDTLEEVVIFVTNAYEGWGV
jgi:hypothetical protein